MQTDLKNILFKCGFDNEIAITTITENDIETIEKAVNADKTILNDCVQYKKEEQFALKPGHRSLILGLPQKFEKYLEHKKVTTTKRKYTKKDNKIVPQTERQNLSETQLKNRLTKQLTTYMLNLKYSVRFINNDISNFEKNESKNYYQCKVKCPFCKKTYVCQFSTCWILSNFQAHLRDHIKKASVQLKNLQSMHSQTATNANLTSSHLKTTTLAPNTASASTTTLAPTLAPTDAPTEAPTEAPNEAPTTSSAIAIAGTSANPRVFQQQKLVQTTSTQYTHAALDSTATRAIETAPLATPTIKSTNEIKRILYH